MVSLGAGIHGNKRKPRVVCKQPGRVPCCILSHLLRLHSVHCRVVPTELRVAVVVYDSLKLIENGARGILPAACCQGVRSRCQWTD